MKHLPTLINFSAGLLLFVLGLVGYASPEWFFTQKYDVIMPSPQSKTILRVIMGFMATMGAIWLAASFFFTKQRRLLVVTGIMTSGFILSRAGGLLLDGLEQHFTYIEMGFETIAFGIIITAYNLSRESR